MAPACSYGPQNRTILKIEDPPENYSTDFANLTIFIGAQQANDSTTGQRLSQPHVHRTTGFECSRRDEHPGLPRGWTGLIKPPDTIRHPPPTSRSPPHLKS